MTTKSELYFEYILLVKEHIILINKLKSQINYLQENVRTFDMLVQLNREINAKK